VPTEGLMQDVLRSSTTTPGELCVMTLLTIQTHKLPAICSALGIFLFPSDPLTAKL